jgi:uncharacterized protein YjbI with pentapeptide repeats/DNA-binding Xre family transcriptional regulator
MSRSIRVRPDLIPRVKLAVQHNGFLRQQDLVEEVGLASSTVRNFLNGKHVDYATFVGICQKLSLEWRDFADSGEITELNRESEEAVIARYSTSEIEQTTTDTLDLAEREEGITKPHIQIEESNTALIEERIFRATEQLNRRGFSVLVGIQALEEIAKDSLRYHWKIMELLAAFVRNAPRRKEEEGIPDNIQAALTIIVRRDWNLPIQTLDLSNTDLRGANLNGANLQGVKLDGANLQEVTLIAANLQKATLKSANLQRAIMHKANLKRANFTEADLQEADLDMTDLEGAELWNTNLQGTRLRAAYLQKAKLIQVNLQGAFIWDSDWRGVILSGVNLRGADFKRRAKNLESRELEDTYGDSKAASSLPENVKAPEHWMQST